MLPFLKDHPKVKEYMRQNASKGGKAGSKANKIRAGRLGAAKRNRDCPRCPLCYQIITPARANRLGIKPKKTSKPK